MFSIGLKNRLEMAHGRDVGLALTNAANLALTSDQVTHQIYLIGGGKSCQMNYKEFLWGMLDSFGVGPLREDAFGVEPYYTDFMNTEESQEVLQFQRFSYEDFLRDIKKDLGIKRSLIRMVGPLARSYLTSQSPYLKKKKSD
jgi:hypothetical protein